jgi:hypothetical protein
MIRLTLEVIGTVKTKMAAISGNTVESKRKVAHPYSRALPIHAQKRRANGDPTARARLRGSG